MAQAQHEDSPQEKWEAKKKKKREKWEAPSPSLLHSSTQAAGTFLIHLSQKMVSISCDEDSFMLWRPCCLVTKSCPTLCDPLDCSPPGSSVHGQEYWSRLPFPSPESLSLKKFFLNFYVVVIISLLHVDSFFKCSGETSLVVQWLWLCASTSWGLDSTPGQGSNILHTMWCDQK